MPVNNDKMQIWIEKQLGTALDKYVGEVNNKKTLSNVKDAVYNVLQGYVCNKIIDQFKINSVSLGYDGRLNIDYQINTFGWGVPLSDKNYETHKWNEFCEGNLRKCSVCGIKLLTNGFAEENLSCSEFVIKDIIE